jgi:CheY-like chemotaxis protein
MPLMSGIQLIEALRKKDENKNIPVIVVSANLMTIYDNLI